MCQGFAHPDLDHSSGSDALNQMYPACFPNPMKKMIEVTKLLLVGIFHTFLPAKRLTELALKLALHQAEVMLSDLQRHLLPKLLSDSNAEDTQASLVCL